MEFLEEDDGFENINDGGGSAVFTDHFHPRE
jgi:hypothetical protein